MIYEMLQATTIGTMLFIFFARITDVSLGTMRIMLISRGYRQFAPVLGFFEVLIWLVTISKALASLSGPLSYVIYAAGFATGNFVGMVIESRISLGYQGLRIITTTEVSALPISLREEGFGVTSVKGRGMKSDVSILFMVMRRKDVARALEIVNLLEPAAFITIEDVKPFRSGYISSPRNETGFFARGLMNKGEE